VRYNEFCYFELPNKEPPPFKTITDWVKWQRKELAASLPVLTDRDQELIQIEKTYESTFIAKGKLSLDKDRLSLTAKSGQTIEFPLETIVDISGFAMMTIIFSTKENKVFEIHSKHPRSALKYLDMFNTIKRGTSPFGLG